MTGMRVEEESHPELWDRLYFNLTFVAEDEAELA